MIITKLDAARLQMDAAIGLYFDEGDESPSIRWWERPTF
jgi:hypothetical protein